MGYHHAYILVICINKKNMIEKEFINQKKRKNPLNMHKKEENDWKKERKKGKLKYIISFPNLVSPFGSGTGRGGVDSNGRRIINLASAHSHASLCTVCQFCWMHNGRQTPTKREKKRTLITKTKQNGFHCFPSIRKPKDKGHTKRFLSVCFSSLSFNFPYQQLLVYQIDPHNFFLTNFFMGPQDF